ncbi:hypothetical protein HID58_057754 [Brassica napus]|uniref:Protein disulfide-isomerase n=1 Tax=Brassica napus TaxID=3708 RepID=A0ABQ7XFG7_BRANA|nr:hypothetical protein HID58_057754 [Brassica napus]
MSETQNSTESVRSSDKIEDTLTRVKVNEENMEQSSPSPYPDRPGERDCQFFLRTGQCGYGNSCRYNHPLSLFPQAVLYQRDELPERIGQPDCEYYLKTGACKYGSTCKYHHPKDRNGAEPGEKSCPYYMQTGMCKFGVACKFHHPHPQPHNGQSTTHGMSSFPYSMMSLPPATYGVMPPPQVPHPQAYMPFMFAPPQGWSPYMAGSNPIYNVKTQPDSSSERAECRFYMNTGTCKYGDDCKYSHPKERMLQSPPNLSHHIVLLPARPGQPACGNFKAYGFCKYGPNCKYDHPSSPVSTQPRSSTPPSRCDSTAISNGDKPGSENNSSEVEKQDEDISDKSEVQESSQLSGSDSTAISNGDKPAADNHSSEVEKHDDSSDKTEVQGSSQLSGSESTVIANGNKPAAESHSSEIEKQDEDISDKTVIQQPCPMVKLMQRVQVQRLRNRKIMVHNRTTEESRTHPVLNSNGVVLVEFFAPWCGHCKALTPTWEKVAGVLKGVATVAAIDADAHQSAAQDYGIKGFPTITVFVPGKPPVDYQGARDAKSIANFAYKQVKALVSNRLEGKSKPNGGGSSERKSEPSASVELTSSNFDELVIKSNDLWIVEFFAPWCGHCKKLAPEWKKAAKNLKGKVKLGHVNCDVEQSIMSRFKVQGFPTIMVFGADKSSPYAYEGARSASAIESFATELVESKKYKTDILQFRVGGGSNSAGFREERRNNGSDEREEEGVYAPLKSAFELQHLLEFVKDAEAGGKGNLPMNGTPEIVDTKAWDGKDGEVIEEDEFSLEELMGGDDDANVGIKG